MSQVLSRARGPAGRVLVYALALWAAVSLVFLLPRLLPGDPIQQLQDRNSSIYIQDVQSRQRLAAYFGLDRPEGGLKPIQLA